MENTRKSMNLDTKKVLSLVGLIVFSLAFIFACMRQFLPIGNWLVNTFGFVAYPMFAVLAIVELARFLGLSYKRSSKMTLYLLIVLFSILFVIQSITTYQELNKVVDTVSLKAYMNYSYTGKTTIVGAFGSIFVGALSLLLGSMGTIVIYVILFTIFVGLAVDYQHYGRFEEKHIRKLKTTKIREKVSKSDKNATNGAPDYTFQRNVSNQTIEKTEVIDEIHTTEEEYVVNQTNDLSTFTYEDNEVVGTVETTPEEYQETSSFQETNIYEASQPSVMPAETNPNIYSEDDMQSFRDFMKATYGESTIKSAEEVENTRVPEFTTEPTFLKTQEPEIDYEPSQEFGFAGLGGQFEENVSSQKEYEYDNSEPLSIFGGQKDDIGIQIDENITNIINKPEDDIDEAMFQPQEESVSINDNIGVSNFGILNSESVTPEPVQAPIQPPIQQPIQSPISRVNEIPQQNKGIMPETKPGIPEVVVPQKKTVPTGINIGMPGIKYNPPPLTLLRLPIPDNGNYEEEQKRKSEQLENVLKSFNIPATVVNIVRGPKITRYELSVPLGVPVKKIPNYELDIQRSLAAKTITIKAPIPGSQYVGIELENDTFTSVYERELLESSAFQNAKDPLPIAIGKDISGEIVVKSLAKMVHVLIAGSTGSGKSVFIHNIVLSLIFKYSPDNLRLVMIDPKKVEFNIYNGLPHLITPEVVMGSEKAINALKWCVKEMDRRYDLMSKAGYNNIEPYNKSDLVKAGQFEHLPYIVIIVDELAEIMVANKKESEVCIQRITQLARACGMHLVLATQRPSVDIISGVIKNNVPSRIAFSLQTGIDSKTILGTVGAEKLLGQGDMIFSPTGTQSMPRLQAAYATDDEIKAIIDYDIKNNVAVYDETVQKRLEEPDAGSVDAAGSSQGGDGAQSKDKLDDLFITALKIFIQNKDASVSYLQRRLSIGYSRAARIVDQMEEKGYIAPPAGSKRRNVLITEEQFREEFGEDPNSL